MTIVTVSLSHYFPTNPLQPSRLRHPSQNFVIKRISPKFQNFTYVRVTQCPITKHVRVIKRLRCLGEKFPRDFIGSISGIRFTLASPLRHHRRPPGRPNAAARPGASIIFLSALLHFYFHSASRSGGPLVVVEKKCVPRTRLIGTGNTSTVVPRLYACTPSRQPQCVRSNA